MEDDFMTGSSLSENTTEPGEEGSAPGTESGEAENSPGEEGQGPSDNTETPEQEPSAQETGSENGSLSENELQELLDSISTRFEQKDDDVVDLTESIRSLVNLMSTNSFQQGGVYVPPEILIEGYKEWDYPVTVDYLISIVGYEDYLPQSATYDDHEQFLEDFQDLAWNCYRGDVFRDFYIDKAYDANGNKVYDSQPEQEPEPEPEEPVQEDDTVAQLLSHLEGVNDTLMEMNAADTEFYESVLLYQEDILELQKASVALEIVMAAGIFLTFGALLVKIMMEKLR